MTATPSWDRPGFVGRRAKGDTDGRQKEQARTEQYLEEFMQRTDKAIDRLAAAQARTEGAVRHLAQQVGALSEVVGFGIEDIARVVLPGYLQRHLAISVDTLERRFFCVDGSDVEINLFGEGVRGGERVVIGGECKARIRAAEVEEFLAAVRKVEHALATPVVKIMFGFWIHPSATERAGEEVLLIASYQR